MVWNVVSGIYIFFFGTRFCFYNAGLKIFTVVDTLYDPTNNPPMSIITHSSTLCYETITNHFAIKTHSQASYQTQFTLKNTRQQQNHEKLSQRSLFIHAIVTDLRATPSDRAPTPDPVLFWATSTNTKHVPTTRSLAPFLVIGPLSAHAKLFFPLSPPRVFAVPPKQSGRDGLSRAWVCWRAVARGQPCFGCSGCQHTPLRTGVSVAKAA